MSRKKHTCHLCPSEACTLNQWSKCKVRNLWLCDRCWVSYTAFGNLLVMLCPQLRKSVTP